MKIKQILIVEDSRLFVQVLKEFLGRSGCNIYIASDGNNALKLIESNPPDLVLMDLYMKGMDGDKCCSHIKSNPVTKDIPVIMLTSAGMDEDVERCKNAGCDEYITKPIEKMVLLDKIRPFLDMPVRQSRRAPICTPAIYYFDKEQYKGTIYCIGESGLFIKGERMLDKGSSIKVSFDIADFARGIEALGEVVWNTDERQHLPDNVGPGFGIRFTSISDERIDNIKRYIDLGNYLY